MIEETNLLVFGNASPVGEPVSVNDLLAIAKDNLQDVVIIGVLNDGRGYLASSLGNSPEMKKMLKQADNLFNLPVTE